MPVLQADDYPHEPEMMIYKSVQRKSYSTVTRAMSEVTELPCASVTMHW